jgi:hypothetical protein
MQWRVKGRSTQRTGKDFSEEYDEQLELEMIPKDGDGGWAERCQIT